MLMTILRVGNAQRSLLRFMVLLALTAVVASGCSGGGERQPRVLAVTQMAPGPVLMELSVDLDAATEIEVDYWTGGSPRLRVRASKDSASAILLSQLKPDSTYSYEIQPYTALGRTGPVFSGTFTTGSLPAALAAFNFVQTGMPSSPLTLLEIRDVTFNGMVVLNKNADVVWYFQTVGGVSGHTRRANGNFVFLDNTDGLLEVAPDGSLVNTLAQQPNARLVHHDLMATPDDTILVVTEHRQMVNNEEIVGDAIWEWAPESGSIELRWNAFDFLSYADDVGPRTQPNDWLHTNSMAYGPRGNIVLSLQFLDQLVSITPDFQAFEWRLGGPSSDFFLEADAVFSGEHTAVEIEENTIVMFDNRRVPTDGMNYSRALEISIDTTMAIVSKAWEFRAPNDNYAQVISSARRLDNGNTVVNFGTTAGIRDSSGPIEVYEVTRAGDIVWNLVVDGPRSMYRATPLTHINGEFEVIE